MTAAKQAVQERVGRELAAKEEQPRKAEGILARAERVKHERILALQEYKALTKADIAHVEAVQAIHFRPPS
eukprot:6198286-Pleurochrysis_carterae.AAC.1